MMHGHRPTQPPTPIPSRPPTPVHFTKAHYVTDLHQVLSTKKGPNIGTENQQRLHQAWPSFSVFLKNCDSGNTYSFPFTLLFESSLSGQGLSVLQITYTYLMKSKKQIMIKSILICIY